MQLSVKDASVSKGQSVVKTANLIFSNLTCVITLGRHVRNKGIKRGGYTLKLLLSVLGLFSWLFCLFFAFLLWEHCIIHTLHCCHNIFPKASLPLHIIAPSRKFLYCFFVCCVSCPGAVVPLWRQDE